MNHSFTSPFTLSLSKGGISPWDAAVQTKISTVLRQAQDMRDRQVVLPLSYTGANRHGGAMPTARPVLRGTPIFAANGVARFNPLISVSGVSENQQEA